MAVKVSRATGNWLTSGTWQTVDSTSYNNVETTTTALTTSYQTSSTFTPGAITVSGIMVKLSVRTGTTGTMTVALDQAGSDVSGTPVTINTADLPVAATADLNGGWVFFKFSSPVTLSAATAYGLKAKTSSSSQVSLFSTATTNWARALVTTTSATPIAGDDVIICGEYTGAGTSNSFTVTMNETATTDYGAASTSLVLPSLAICSKGTLSYGTTAATNYYLRQSGNVIIYSGGTLNIGSSGAEMPRDSTAKLNFDCGANVDFGLTVRNLGTFNTAGLSRTSGKNIYYCKLTADIATNATSWTGVDTDTGWLSGDAIAVASTTRTVADCEQGTLNGAAGASSMTVNGFAGTGGGVAVAHSGTSPTQAEVILLTRNVQIFGASATLQGYIDIKATATVSCIWTEFKWLGSATANKRGIDVATTTGSCSFTYCSLRNFEVASSNGFNFSATSGNGFTFSNNVTFKISANPLAIANATSGTWIANSNVLMYNTAGGSVLCVMGDIGGTFTNNILSGATGNGISLAEASATFGTISGNTVHSCGGNLINCTSTGMKGTLDSFTLWRGGNNGAAIFGHDVLVSNLTHFGSGAGCSISNHGARVVFTGLVTSGDTTFSTPTGITFGNAGLSHLDILVYNSTLGVASGIKTAHTTGDISFGALNASRFYLNNTTLASGTPVNGITQAAIISTVVSQKHNQTAGLHKTWKYYGTLTIETTTVHTGSQSLKMTPNNDSFKLESSGANGGFQIAVANGSTLTPSVYIYKDASYNGNQPRLVLKRNAAIGITSDTVISTYASGASSWNAISGTTAAATDDGVMEFVIDCDGTAGNIFVDSFTVT